MNPVTEVQQWVKHNPRIAAAAGLGGAFIFLRKKGSGGSSASTLDGSQVAVLPVATSPNETIPTDNSGIDTSGSDDGSSGDLGTDTSGTETEPPEDHSTDPSSPVPPEPSDSATPATTPAGPSAPATTPTESGVSVSGHNFPGATGRQQVGAGSNAYGSYTIWLISFPNKTERWWHYYKDEKGKGMDKMTGPHNETGNSGSVPKPVTSAPAPTTTTRPTAPAPAPAPTSQPVHSAPVPAPKEQPHMGPNIFYNADRNLRYTIQNKNKKNYRYYESRLNAGDWGKGGVVPQ